MCNDAAGDVYYEQPDRADFVLVNPEKDVLYFDKATTLSRETGPPFAHIIAVSDPSGEWLAESLLAPLSDAQRTAFDRDGIVLLLKHPCRLNRQLPIARIAADAVVFGYERLESKNPIPVQVANQEKPASQENHAASLVARKNHIIAQLEKMGDAGRAAHFVQAFRDKVRGTEDRRVIDLFASEQPEELQEALNEAWAERRQVLQHGAPVARPQPE